MSTEPKENDPKYWNANKKFKETLFSKDYNAWEKENESIRLAEGDADRLEREKQFESMLALHTPMRNSNAVVVISTDFSKAQNAIKTFVGSYKFECAQSVPVDIMNKTKEIVSEVQKIKIHSDYKTCGEKLSKSDSKSIDVIDSSLSSRNIQYAQSNAKTDRIEQEIVLLKSKHRGVIERMEAEIVMMKAKHQLAVEKLQSEQVRSQEYGRTLLSTMKMLESNKERILSSTTSPTNLTVTDYTKLRMIRDTLLESEKQIVNWKTGLEELDERLNDGIETHFKRAYHKLDEFEQQQIHYLHQTLDYENIHWKVMSTIRQQLSIVNELLQIEQV